MQFVRAPDENVYIPPFNLIEIVVACLFEWWMDKARYEHVNDWIMGIIYSPLLVVAAFFETRTASAIRYNRSRGEEDDDVIEEWEQMERDVDFDADGWAKTVDAAKSNVEVEPSVLEVRKLKEEIDELKKMLLEISKAVGAGSDSKAPAQSSPEKLNDSLIDLDVDGTEVGSEKLSKSKQKASDEDAESSGSVASSGSGGD
jgi:hypothetical protein